MAKKITGYIKLQVPAGAANPSPPIGPALGQRGLNIMEFCKAFNAKTAQVEKGTPIPVIITAYQDRSFTFEMKQPPVSFFLKKAVGLKIGKKPAPARRRRRNVVGKVTKAQIARDRRKEDESISTAHTIESAMSMIEGSARRDGPRGGGVRPWRMSENASRRPATGIERTKLYPVDEAVKLVRERRQGQVRRNRSRSP